nr:uncharacterized protein LOC129440231 [Misgurnus anguillicaudatus]
MDLVGKLALTDNGNQYICVIIDYMTKWPQAYPLKSKAAREVADCLLKFVHQFEAPKRVLTDQGKEFVNTLNSHICKVLNIKRSLCAPYHPQTNGLVEKMNATIQRSLCKLVQDKPNEWDRHLDAVMFGLRTKRQITTKFSPYYLMFGREARYPSEIPENYQIDTSVEGTISIEELTESAIALSEILNEAHVNTRASQERVRRKTKQHALNMFKVGDRVWRENKRSQQRKGGKLEANFLGPFTVTFLDGKSADLEDGRGVKFPKINVDHLRLHIEEVPRIPHKLNPSNSVTVASSALSSTASPPLEPSLESPPPVPSPASQPPVPSSESLPPVPSPASLPPVPSPASQPPVPSSESLPSVPSPASPPPVPSPVSPPPVPSPVSSPPVPSPASLPPVPSPASSAQMPSPASSPQMPSPASPPPVPSPVSSPPVPSPASLPPVPSPASSAQMPSPASSPQMPSPASPPPVPSPVSSPPVPSPASLPPVPSPAPPPPVTSPASSAQMPSPASSPQMPSPVSPPPVPSPVSSPPVPSPASLPPVPSPASSAQMPSPASSPASPPPVPPVSSPPVPSPASLPPVPSPAPPPPVTSPASSAQMPSPTSSPASPPPAYLPPVYVVSSASSSPASTQPAHATTASSVVVTSSGSSSSDVESRVKDAWGREGLYVLLSIIGPFKLFYSDIHRTAPTRHIESEVLNAYMYHLVQKYNMQSTKKAVSIDSFEMSNMWKYKKAKVKMDPKTFQFIFGIINEHCHWTLTIMIPQENRALFLDPLGETSKDIQKCQNVTRSFMMQKGYDIPGWACGTLPHSRQPDGSSCGAFVLKFAECFLNNEPLHFSTTEESVADLRMTIAACLLQNSADLKDLCQICGEKNTGKNVTNWIGCDVCPRWFHCRCVQRTRKTKSFTCPVCTP